MRPAAVLIAISCVILAGCGGSDGSSAETQETTASQAPPSGSLEALWRAPGEDVAVVPGTSDYATGVNRISFLVVDKQSRVIERPTARVWIARGLKKKPYAQTVARAQAIGVPGGATADVGSIYVARIETPTPGTYWILAEPVGGQRRIQALGNVVVRAKAQAPVVGDRAIASRTPTLRSTGADLRRLTTSRKPIKALYRSSVAEAMAAKQPFVVSFATPLYCQTRACGPVVDVVGDVASRHPKVRFIHVEIYEGNDPAKGTNRWVREWRLPTEPFTFVVDRTGVIREKLEGAFGAAELDEAVAAVERRS
jgi:hypothetical protein